jgi:hypothetical protein
MLSSVGEPAIPFSMAPLRWITEGRFDRLVGGMPNASSTGLTGERSWLGAESNAKNFGLDEEMLRAIELVSSPRGNLPDHARVALLALTSPGV